MITVRTVCFVCFVLLLGTAHAETNTTPTQETPSKTISTNQPLKTPTAIQSSNTAESNKVFITQSAGCTSSTTKQTVHDGQCILLLPQDTLPLVIVALVVACFTLLMTTLICACQVCHLKAIIYRFKSHHHRNVDLHSIRMRSKSPCRDEGQPTETCLMLSEVTTAQEERNEESVQPSTEPLVDPNGDITQEEGNSGGVESKEPEVDNKEPEVENKDPEVGVESKGPDAGAPENTGV